MLIKLMKQEFKSTVRLYGTVNAGILLFSLLIALFANNDSPFIGFIGGLLFLGWFCFLIAGSLMFLVQSIRIFTKDYFGQTGYLTLTLPVKTGTIIISKFLVLMIWTIITYATIILGFVGIFAMIPGLWAEISFGFAEMGRALEMLNLAPIVPITFIATLIVSPIIMFVLIGFSCAFVRTGFFDKGHGFAAVVLFILLNVAISVITTLVNNFIVPSEVLNSFVDFESIAGFYAMIDYLMYTSWGSTAVNLVFIVLGFLGTVYLIDNKLEMK